MSELGKTIQDNSGMAENVNSQTNNEVTEEVKEIIPSMDEFKDELEASFKKLKEGDILKVTVIGITDKEVIVDLGSYTEGIIPLEELSNDASFSIKYDITVGDSIDVLVINPDDKDGNVILSKKQAEDILAWDKLQEDMKQRVAVNVKIKEAVPAGVICYYRGIRGFLPASQLSLTYVENTEEWVGKTVTAYIITVDCEKKKLVLSAKEVEKEQKSKEKTNRINQLQKGIVTNGVIEKITPYGAFVTLNDGLSGLVHISQICGKHIKSPNEVVKLGDKVNVMIIDIKDGKISLSMKAVEEEADVVEDLEEAPTSYSTGEDATTGLGALLKNIRL